MKKLLLLIPFLILSLKSFSQTDTSKLIATTTDTNKVISSIPDTGKVILSSKVAKLIVKDLMHYDGVKKELELTQFKVVKLEDMIGKKDTMISMYKQKDANNMLVIRQKDEQLRISKELSQKLEKEIKMQKIGKGFFKTAAVVGLMLTTYLLLIN